MKDGVGSGQYGEDRILGLFFRDQAAGLLVDVGAADGYMNSNSIGLLKRPGWKGILIEPESSQFKKLHNRYKNRPGVICVRCGIGFEKGEHTLYRGGSVSTFKEDAKKSAEKMYGIK